MTRAAPAVSVIMPAYNAQRFIAKAIDSVIAQSVPDWQMIIVDDGSTDDTPQILGSYEDARIRTCRQRNMGESVARNRALDLADGDYVLFLDADDLLLPTALEQQVGFLAAHSEFVASYSDGYFCDDMDRRLGTLTESRWATPSGEILEQLLLAPSMLFCPACVLVRGEAIRENRLRFDEGLRVGEDWDFWVQLAATGWFGYLHSQTCVYRLHAKSQGATSDPQRRRDDWLSACSKAWSSSWFGAMSPGTRRDFYEQILVHVLSGAIEEQREIIGSPTFLDLPELSRASLLRHVATDSITFGDPIEGTGRLEFAMECLSRAHALAPRDTRTWIAKSLLRADPRAAIFAIQSWSVAASVARSIRGIGRRSPKPVPTVLLPEETRR